MPLVLRRQLLGDSEGGPWALAALLEVVEVASLGTGASAYLPA